MCLVSKHAGIRWAMFDASCVSDRKILPIARAVEFQGESLLYDPIVDFQQNHDDLNEC